MGNKRIGLDVDGVLSCFSAGVISRAKQLGLEDKFPTTCKDVDCWDMSDKFSSLMRDVWTDEEFWLNLPVLKGSEFIPFTPDCYITSRQVPSEVTKQWLDKNRFPEADVITVRRPEEKIQHILERNVDIFVDDLFSTVRTLREKGINALLFKAAYQSGHIKECEGLPTIESLKEIKNYV
jgi:5'(3')-deoxyribonucleotidase